jgi:hypothetical protein
MLSWIVRLLLATLRRFDGPLNCAHEKNMPTGRREKSVASHGRGAQRIQASTQTVNELGEQFFDGLYGGRRRTNKGCCLIQFGPERV